MRKAILATVLTLAVSPALAAEPLWITCRYYQVVSLPDYRVDPVDRISDYDIGGDFILMGQDTRLTGRIDADVIDVAAKVGENTMTLRIQRATGEARLATTRPDKTSTTWDGRCRKSEGF